MKRLAALLLALLICLCCGAAAFAETTYTTVAGTSTSFDKYLRFKNNSNPPNLTFEYSIAAGQGIAAANGTMEVLPGSSTPALPTITPSQATFSPTDTRNTAVASGDQVTLSDGFDAYVKKQVTISFSNTKFDEPGIYRYILTEQTIANQPAVEYDTGVTAGNGITKMQRVLDVYVTDKNDGTNTLQVSQYVIHDKLGSVTAGTGMGSADVTTAGAALSDKSKGFVNDYQTYDLTVSKTVTGNQASRDKYFKFTVAITNAGANTALNINLTNAATAPTKTTATNNSYTAAVMAAANGADDNTTLTGQQWVTNASGTVTKDIYLQHGQSIVIQGLPKGAKYTVTEVPEDYAPTAKINNTDAALTNGATAEQTMNDDSTVAFTNTRAGNVPTGVMLTVIPGVLIVAAAAAGLIVMKKKGGEGK